MSEKMVEQGEGGVAALLAERDRLRTALLAIRRVADGKGRVEVLLSKVSELARAGLEPASVRRGNRWVRSFAPPSPATPPSQGRREG